MKNVIFFFLIAAVAVTGCNSSTVADEDVDKSLLSEEIAFQVKVVATLCGYAILEIVDVQYFEYGMNWVDGGGRSYEHVFGTEFPCFTEAKAGEIITIQILEKPEVNDSGCARCDAYLETPDKKYFVKVIK